MGTDVVRSKTDEPIAVVRAFNRFYTRQIGLLDESLLDSAFSLTEVRVLYELAHADAPTAADLVRALGLDAGYMSRLLRRLQVNGLLVKRRSTSDARQTVLGLTAKGRKAIAAVEAATDRQLATMLGAVPAPERERLVHSMRTIHGVLGTRSQPSPPYLIRDPRPGDIGWTIHRQAILYAQEFGWDWTFEGLAAEIAGAFVREFDPAFERCWIAERSGDVVGAVFVVRKSKTVAQLRMLYVEPSARGLGIGARLVDECVAFARARHYRRLTLWTNSVLGSARKIYQAAGFVLVDEEKHRSFGKDLVGQNWDLMLSMPRR